MSLDLSSCLAASKKLGYEGFLSLRDSIVESDAHVDTHGDQAHIKVRFGNVQPGQTAWSNGVIYIGATTPTTIDLDVFLYGDNIPTPLPVHLQVNIQTKSRTLDIRELERRR